MPAAGDLQSLVTELWVISSVDLLTTTALG